jgi:hypothetical protein
MVYLLFALLSLYLYQLYVIIIEKSIVVSAFYSFLSFENQWSLFF